MNNPNIYEMACKGDSGSPVFKYRWSGGVTALGLVSGGNDVEVCNAVQTDTVYYTPIDEITRSGHSVLTSHYSQHYYLNVWWDSSLCIEYYWPVDDNGNIDYSERESESCRTSLPSGSSGTIESYNAYQLRNFWHEAMWRGGKSYIRAVPLNNNGTINYASAPSWTYLKTATAPRAQEGYVVGNHYYLVVFWTESDCKEYRWDITDSGYLGSRTEQNCRTSAPGSGTIQSYNGYIVSGELRESIWRNYQGYLRTVPLNSTNTEINWNSAPAWSSCCGPLAPREQGGKIITHPPCAGNCIEQ